MFQAAYDLEEAADTAAHERARLERALGWLGANMRKPGRLAVSRRPHAKAQAICWFKDTAVEHIARVHELVGILYAHGIVVEVIQTQRPGYVVFEDDVQVAAYPFADTPA